MSGGQNENFTASWTTRGSSARGDRPEVGRAQLAGGAPKFTVFSKLNTSSPQLDRAITPDADEARQREIDVPVRWPSHRIARRRPDRELIRRRERSCVEPAIRCPLVSGQSRIANEMRPLRREAGVTERVCLRHRDRDAGLQRHEARDVPIVHQCADDATSGASHGPRLPEIPHDRGGEVRNVSESSSRGRARDRGCPRRRRSSAVESGWTRRTPTRRCRSASNGCRRREVGPPTVRDES